jgi:hypothetical protein
VNIFSPTHLNELAKKLPDPKKAALAALVEGYPNAQAAPHAPISDRRLRFLPLLDFDFFPDRPCWLSFM